MNKKCYYLICGTGKLPVIALAILVLIIEVATVIVSITDPPARNASIIPAIKTVRLVTKWLQGWTGCQDGLAKSKDHKTIITNHVVFRTGRLQFCDCKIGFMDPIIRFIFSYQLMHAYWKMLVKSEAKNNFESSSMHCHMNQYKTFTFDQCHIFSFAF